MTPREWSAAVRDHVTLKLLDFAPPCDITYRNTGTACEDPAVWGVRLDCPLHTIPVRLLCGVHMGRANRQQLGCGDCSTPLVVVKAVSL